MNAIPVDRMWARTDQKYDLCSFLDLDEEHERTCICSGRPFLNINAALRLTFLKAKRCCWNRSSFDFDGLKSEAAIIPTNQHGKTPMTMTLSPNAPSKFRLPAAPCLLPCERRMIRRTELLLSRDGSRPSQSPSWYRSLDVNMGFRGN